MQSECPVKSAAACPPCTEEAAGCSFGVWQVVHLAVALVATTVCTVASSGVPAEPLLSPTVA